MSFLVEENPAKHRFEILVDDALAGFSAYLPRGEVLVFTHTEVDDRYQGQGVGAALVGGMLDQIRARGGRVVPRCPFVAAFVERHPEYADLVVDAP
ncbi:GNAT family N-acetyltransferase [Micromonospora sp. WMMD1128]|uniref:GNAT family N-acetyltransferase n=1 Tax=unclassified Micromonospora TaxID=2617518 RepID=UPI00248B377E|nr:MULTISPECIES: GNAT family N-acetyltransferase [unclassified Micromonospora]WBB71640.1 GNAT family N-acetyltransferase [Micromonospora sp. WMMD1128]WFE34911.1 GNAT family N-acetyltransferase [Micromonospora sp. WMMD975]WFE39598.1 GNAT family N-acetyltransferase [Micromonospora sp. WMMD998]